MNTKKDRSINKLPTELEKFLEIFNAVRMSILFNDSKFDERRFKAQHKGLFWNETALRERLEKTIHADHQGQKENLINFFNQEIPPVIKNNDAYCQYLFNLNWNELDIETSELFTKGYRYINFGRAVFNFEQMMERVDWFHEKYKLDPEEAKKEFFFPTGGGKILVLNKKGFTEERDYEFIRFTGIDPRRLKRCLNCQKVFWALRLNAKYCSESCSDTYHRKIYLANEANRIAYNEQRRKTYISKKEQNQAKAKNKKDL